MEEAIASLWWLLIACILAKFIGTFGHTIALHRYFSHRSFNTTETKEKILAWISLFVGVGSPIGFAYNHRHHHREADTQLDWHSPKNLECYFTFFLINSIASNPPISFNLGQDTA